MRLSLPKGPLWILSSRYYARFPAAIALAAILVRALSRSRNGRTLLPDRSAASVPLAVTLAAISIWSSAYAFELLVDNFTTTLRLY